MASACVKSFEPGVTRNNFVAEVTVTLVSASASVAMVNDSLPIALIVPKTGGVFAGAAVGVPVCASVQTTLISASQRQAPARTALPAKTLRVSNRSICINSPRVPSRGREREAAWTLRCRAGKTYRLDADKGVSRFIELHRCTGFSLCSLPYSSLRTLRSSSAPGVYPDPVGALNPDLPSSHPHNLSRGIHIHFHCARNLRQPRHKHHIPGNHHQKS